MSGRINLSNLSDSLKEHLNGLGLTEEQVNELIENALIEINEKNVEQDEVVNGLVDKVGELNGLMTEEKGDLVGAINELFQSANNGKELIASAIGEPLDSNDTFSAMSNDINGLLSTFKINMMNNGITVDNDDKFKQLIDKIKTISENKNKGIQFAEGSGNWNLTATSGTRSMRIQTNLKFKPTYVFCLASKLHIYSSISLTHDDVMYNALISNLTTNVYGSRDYDHGGYSVYDVTADGFTIGATYWDTFQYASCNIIKWVAIGISEEDTSLRDTLAGILENEGVDVTEEDDMASLITKVDEEFNDKNNEMSSLNTNITLLTNQVNNLTSELAGKVTPAGNAVAANVLSGKTFINSTGQVVTGTMANNGTKTINPKASAQTLGDGYYDKITINGDADLVAANIVSGKNIFGVAGTATVSSLGGKQFATGTSSTFDNSTTWTYYNGTKAEGVYTLSVTGLSFTPSTVIAYGNLGTPYGYVFSCLHSDFAICMPKIRDYYNSNWNVAQGRRYKKIQVTNGFKLPIEKGSGTLTWVAFA